MELVHLGCSGLLASFQLRCTVSQTTMHMVGRGSIKVTVVLAAQGHELSRGVCLHGPIFLRGAVDLGWRRPTPLSRTAWPSKSSRGLFQVASEQETLSLPGFEEIQRIELRVGKITGIRVHPEADE